MKKSSDRLNVGSAGNEKIGALLSASLKQAQNEECLSSEEIAVLIEGNVEANDRDRMMNHLSTCDRCYDVFLLTSGLSKQEIVPMRRTFFSHPMRLAASIIIAAFSLFLFYKIVFIPGISDKPDLEVETGKEAAAPLMKEGHETEKREKGSGVLRMVEKRGAEAGEKKAARSFKKRILPAGRPAEEFSPVESQPGIAAKKGGEKKTAIGSVKRQEPPAEQEVVREPEEQNLRQFQKTKISEPVRQDASTQDSQVHQQQTLPKQRQRGKGQQAATAAKQRQYVREAKDTKLQETVVPEKVALGDKRKKGKGLGKSAAATAVPAGMETAPWSAFERLSRELSQYKTYIPDDKIENLFQTAVIAAEKMQHEFREQEENRYAIDGLRVQDPAGKRFAPVMQFESEREIVSIFPDTRYFLGKSEPGTRAYRFFSLALSGWCDERGCYGELKGKIEKEKREKLLKSWQALRPELQGIFLTIADRTINHLKK